MDTADNSGDWIRTSDLRAMNPPADSATIDTAESYKGSMSTPSNSPSSSGAQEQMEHDLRHLVDSWPTLPEPIRAGIMAMVHAIDDSR